MQALSIPRDLQYGKRRSYKQNSDHPHAVDGRYFVSYQQVAAQGR